jgi:ribulose-5-phosphate 4-epimerase/fuculose-1-phosphate aldolase
VLIDSRQSPSLDLNLERHRLTVATACRIMAFRGLAEDLLGHVSLRLGDELLVRCRGPRERGLLFTQPDEVRVVRGDGTLDSEDHKTPNELPIHTEILRARPDAMAVVHAHPPAVIAADLAGLPLRPIIGAYNIPASRMAQDGIPTYERSVLVNSPELGVELAGMLGDKPVCVMRGHGIVAVGSTVQQAVGRALAVDALARLTLQASVGGRAPEPMPSRDLDTLPDLGTGFDDDQMWRFNEASLSAAGLALTDSSIGTGPV